VGVLRRVEDFQTFRHISPSHISPSHISPSILVYEEFAFFNIIEMCGDFSFQVALPVGVLRRVEDFQTFLITAFHSVWAYVWLCIILMW